MCPPCEVEIAPGADMHDAPRCAGVSAAGGMLYPGTENINRKP